MSILLGLLVVIILVAANAFFVAVEFALVAADRQRLETEAGQGKWPAKAAVAALRRLSFHLSGAQLGITLSSLVLGRLTEPIVVPLLVPVLELFLDDAEGRGITVAVGLLMATVFQMVAGELVPKNIAITHPEVSAKALAPMARVVHGVLSPAIIVFNGVANWFIRRLGVEPKEELEAQVSMDELAFLIRSSAEVGTLAPESQELLTRTLRFGDKTAADALIPRPHLHAVLASATVADLAAEVGRTGHTRYPVHDGELDNIRGIVSVASVFETPPTRRDRVTVGEVMAEPLIVPETRDLGDLLSDFRESNHQMAVVIDEHGGTAGILTLEDVLEELVGEVDDEFDVPQVRPEGVDGSFHVVAGTLHLDEVADRTGLVLPDGEYETIAGFVLERLGRIPDVGDSEDVNGWTVVVAEMDGLRVASLELREPAGQPGTAGAGGGSTR